MNTPLIYDDRKDRRALATLTSGELAESFRRSSHYGERGAENDIRSHGPRNEDAIRHAAATLDTILMSTELEPLAKFQAVAAFLGYVGKQHEGWCRLHIPLVHLIHG